MNSLPRGKGGMDFAESDMGSEVVVGQPEPSTLGGRVEDGSGRDSTSVNVVNSYRDDMVPTGIPEFDNELGGLKPKELVVISSHDERTVIGLVTTIGAMLGVEGIGFAFGEIKRDSQVRQKLVEASLHPTQILYFVQDQRKNIRERLRQFKSNSQGLRVVLMTNLTVMKGRIPETCNELKALAKALNVAIVVGVVHAQRKGMPTLASFDKAAEAVDVIFHVRPPSGQNDSASGGASYVLKARCGSMSDQREEKAFEWKSNYDLDASHLARPALLAAASLR